MATDLKNTETATNDKLTNASCVKLNSSDGLASESLTGSGVGAMERVQGKEGEKLSWKREGLAREEAGLATEGAGLAVPTELSSRSWVATEPGLEGWLSNSRLEGVGRAGELERRRVSGWAASTAERRVTPSRTGVGAARRQPASNKRWIAMVGQA